MLKDSPVWWLLSSSDCFCFRQQRVVLLWKQLKYLSPFLFSATLWYSEAFRIPFCNLTSDNENDLYVQQYIFQPLCQTEVRAKKKGSGRGNKKILPVVIKLSDRWYLKHLEMGWGRPALRANLCLSAQNYAPLCSEGPAAKCVGELWMPTNSIVTVGDGEIQGKRAFQMWGAITENALSVVATCLIYRAAKSRIGK